MSVSFYRFEIPIGTPLEPLMDFIVKLLGANQINHELPYSPDPNLALSHPIEEEKAKLLRSAIDFQNYLASMKTMYPNFKLVSSIQGPDFIQMGFEEGDHYDHQININT